MRTGTSHEIFLGRYHSLERLGSGPLGESFRGRLYGLGGFEKDFAITRIDRRLCQDPALIGRLVRAASLAAQLQAERLARIQTVDVEDGQYYLVCDLARGLDLALLCDLLAARGERLPRSGALSIALDVAEVLESCHGRVDLQPGGIAHLGLSPHAVVVDEEGESRVIGMGLLGARIAPGFSEDDAVLPRLGYLAPEVVAARPADGRADLFSLGAILHELTSGAPDDPELATLIRRALASDLELRLQKVAELRRALELRLPERQPARRELGQIVARWLAAPGPVELAQPEAPPEPARTGTPDALDWDSGEIALFGGAPALGDQITNRVPTTPAPLLPAPPTLPLSAMRTPLGAFLARAIRPAAVALMLVASGVGLGLLVRRARRSEASAAVAAAVPRRAVVPAP
ncbi:MAG TPA: protein kinase, partial [Polyangia bacterium]